MDLWTAIQNRHSVRQYTDKQIEEELEKELMLVIEECNKEGDLKIQLCLNEPNAFSGVKAKYGKFKNVKNYIALVGSKSDIELEEKCGYYGEKVVLRAQQLGLNTCWVAITYRKNKSGAQVDKGDKLLMVIALGYGENNGAARKTKSIEKLSKIEDEMPDWFKRGMEAVQLAPTAMNQQRFVFELENKKVRAIAGFGIHTKVDLGIAKYHFEVGATDGNWYWA